MDINADLMDIIVTDLVRHRGRNEIIRHVCEQAGLNWREAERLVKQVEERHSRTIARRQSPFLIFLSVGTLLIGLVLVLYSILFFVDFLHAGSLQQLLSLPSVYYRIAGALTGAGMVIGGMIGLWKTVLPLLDD